MALTQTEEQAWNDELLKDPHAVADKRRRVKRMFAAIAPSYDLNNRLHSLWMDQYWRHVAVKMAQLKPTDTVVDVACGTGDLTLAFARGLKKAGATTLRPGQVIGVDFTYEMLPIARKKGKGRALWINGDAQAISLPDACCDVVSIAFGIRNVQDTLTAIRQFRRILRPGGRLVILEFSLPTNAALRSMYNFYFRQVLPRTATLISWDKSGAYKYLPESVNTYIDRARMVELMEKAGFTDIQQRPLTFGISVAYCGTCA